MAWVGDVLSTTSSFVVLLASPFIMRRRISGMVYCSVPPPGRMGHCGDSDGEVSAAGVVRSHWSAMIRIRRRA
jgi:hypothetical protein